MRAWMVRAGADGEREEAALSLGRVIAGWQEVGDLSDVTDREALRDRLRDVYPEASTGVLANWTGQLWRFTRVIAVGDIVVLPLKRQNAKAGAELALGRITASYEYDTSADWGYRHVRPVEWLNRVPRGALNSDLLDSLGALLTICELKRHKAADRILAVLGGDPDPGWTPEGHAAELFSNREALLAHAVEQAPTDPMRLSIRQLLAYWGASRRTDELVSEVERELAESGVVAVPAISDGWLDDLVALAPLPSAPNEGATRVYAAPPTPPAAVSVSISTLMSATGGVVSVNQGDSLDRVVTLLLQHNFSQLPVLNDEGNVVGAVSWESIGRAHLGHEAAQLSDALMHPPVVTSDADLLDVILDVSLYDFVIVRASDSFRPIGLVTVADLSVQYRVMASPFTLVEEVERRLRRATDERVPLTAMKAAVGPKNAHVQSASNLTMGNYKYLYAESSNFERLGWSLDHDMFLELLGAVHSLRNSLMHFSTDPLSEEDLAPVRSFLQILRVVDPRT